MNILKIIWRCLLLIKYNGIRFFSLFFAIFKIEENKIVVDSFFGKGYSDSPKAIVEYLNKNIMDLKIIWLVKEYSNDFPDNIIQVKYGSIKALKELATAKVWIDNSRKAFVTFKRKEQKYLQTWHGSIPLKKIEKDARTDLSCYYEYISKVDSKYCDMMISGSSFQSNIIKSSFWYNGEILEVGTPRLDTFFNLSGTTKDSIKRNLNLSQNSILVLYAPTFRVNEDINFNNLPIQEIKQIIEGKYKKKCEILLRLHPIDANKIKKNIEGTIDVSNYSDMQELLIICDYLITDYSSSMFDTLCTNKSCILYPYDYEEYTSTNRDLYFNMKNLPFPVAYNKNELIDCFSKFNNNEYRYNIEEFKNKIGMIEDGKAAEKVSNIINYWIQ